MSWPGHGKAVAVSHGDRAARDYHCCQHSGQRRQGNAERAEAAKRETHGQGEADDRRDQGAQAERLRRFAAGEHRSHPDHQGMQEVDQDRHVHWQIGNGAEQAIEVQGV